MATLYGTTVDGETLPVLVNEFGQLVAQGLPGEQGIQGPPGPEGPPAEGADVEEGAWTPRFGADQDGEAFLSYSTQDGYFYRMGRMMTIWFVLATSDVAITNARGDLQIQGLPRPLQGYSHRPSLSYGVGSLSMYGGFKGRDASNFYCRLSADGTALDIFTRDVTGPKSLRFSDLDDENPDRNRIAGSWSGLVDGL